MKPYKIALLAGTHQHRWPDDGSGICEKCHREHSPHIYQSNHPPNVCRICGAVGKCQHTAGFSYSSPEQHSCKNCFEKINHTHDIVGTETVCWHCPDCNNYHSFHTFNEGGCTVCGWICPHSAFSPDGDSGHTCNKCNMFFEHTMQTTGTAAACMTCSVCGYSTSHTGISVVGDTCPVCGYKHSEHIWSSGKCKICGIVCSHPSVNSLGCCTTCGTLVLMDQTDLYGFGSSGGYDGVYHFDREINYQGGDNLKIYRGYRRENSTWIATGYNLFSFAVYKNITQFGGDYAYRITGYVFTKNDSVNVSPALLNANGVRYLKLAQYNLDGSLRDADTAGYTSDDCMFSATDINIVYNWNP